MLEKGMRNKVFDHIKVNAREKAIRLDTIGGYVDHVHVLISLGSDQTIAKISQLLKGESSHWANQDVLTRNKIEWQDEYTALSVGESMLDNVREYIRGQEEHHRKKTFAEEYRELLKGQGYSFDGLKSAESLGSSQSTA